MQKEAHTTFLLLLKKKNEHEVLVICATCKKMFFKCLKKITQGNSGKFKVTQGSFFDSKSGNPVRTVYILKKYHHLVNHNQQHHIKLDIY